MNSMKVEFTGERMIPEINRHDLIYAEHTLRYFFASQFAAGKIVLDVASGSGYGSRLLFDKGARRVVGVDISQEAVAYAKEKYEKPGIEFLVGDAESLPFRYQTFDLVISFETIEHVQDCERFLQEIRRVLKKDGVVIFSTPNALVYPKGNIFHIKEFTPVELTQLLRLHFRYVELLYQHSVLASYVLPESMLAQGERRYQLQSLLVPGGSKEEHMYLVAICSDGTLTKPEGSVVLFTDQELKKQEAMIESLRRELNLIYNSRSWKILSFLRWIWKFTHFMRKTKSP